MKEEQLIKKKKQIFDWFGLEFDDIEDLEDLIVNLQSYLDDWEYFNEETSK